MRTPLAEEFAESTGFPLQWILQAEERHAGARHEFFKEIMETFDAQTSIAALHATYRQRSAELVPHRPDACAALEELLADGWALGVVTNGAPDAQRTKLEVAQLRRYFGSVVTSLPSELIKPAWESTFDRLTDIEMTTALGALDSDVLITTTPALMAAAAGLVPSRVITVHQEHRASQLRSVTGEPLLVYAPCIDALVSLTERTNDWFADSLGATAPELVVIPNAVPDGFRPRSDLDSKTIMLAARMTPEKQLDHAIEAFATLGDEHPDWTMRIFGDGPQEVRLRRIIDGLALHDRVQLLGRSSEMEQEWAKASLALLPSRNEAFPLVLLEMFAAGVPVIAYDIVTGPAEIVRHGIDGLLVPAGDKESLAIAMAKLMEDDDTRRAYGKAAREGVHQRFGAAKITARWEELFSRLMARRDVPKRLAERADRTARRIAASGSRSFNVAAPISVLADSADAQKAREVVLQAQDHAGTLVRSAGRLAEVRNDILAPRMAEWNLETATSALVAHGIPYILLRDGGTNYRIAVEAERREQVLDALASELHGQPVYAELITPRGAAPGAVLAERLRAAGDVAGLRVFKPLTTESRTLRYGPAFGCTVEFWTMNDEDDEMPGWRSAPCSSTLLGPHPPSLETSGTLRVILADIAFLVIAYTVAAVGAAWASRLVLAVAPVAGVLATLRWGKADWGDARVVALQSLLSTLVFVLSWGIGSAVRTRRAYWRQLEERAAHLEKECETQERIAVSAERARIARELHDLVAHSMSVMIVQADGASCAIDSAPGQARQALDTIALTGRHALDEMHQVVGLFQDDAAGAGEKATPPVGLDELERAVQQSRSAGLPVDFQVEGSQRAFSEEAGLTVYRLLQEALTNTRKHAGPAARATVRLTYFDPDIEILVEDDGRGETHSFSEKREKDGHGHGLLGMRERIALLGGQIEQGNRPGGGFRIWARLPLHPADHQPPTSTTSHGRSGD